MNTPKKSLCVNEHDLGGQLDPNPGPWGVIKVFLKIFAFNQARSPATNKLPMGKWLSETLFTSKLNNF